MAQKRTTDQSLNIARAALKLAAEKGWRRVTVKEAARRAKASVRAAEAHFDDAWDMLLFALIRIERETATQVKPHLGASWRDNLGEILMARFEAAQQDRAAYAALPAALARDPQAAFLRLLPRFHHMLDEMLNLAGLPDSPCRPAQRAALGMLCLSVAHTWSRDETPDLSKTMSAIDKRLGWLEKAMTLV